MDKLTIGELSDAFPPLMDGVGFVVKNYTEILRARGHEAYAVVSGSLVKDGKAYDAAQGIDYTIRSSMVPVPGMIPYGFVVQNRPFRKRVQQIDFDIIHTHAPFFLGRIGEKIVRNTQIPIITTFHTLYKDDFLGFTHSKTMAEQLTRMILRHYRSVDEVWTTTEWSKRKLQEYGFDGNIEVVLNGCDFPLPSESEYESYRKKAREDFPNIPTDVPRLLYVGQLKKEKNIETTIAALSIIHRRKIPFHMVFVGMGPDERLFKQTIEENGFANKVTFTGKLTDREKLKAIMASSDLFLFPSQYDTSPLVLQEASAFRLPLLNTTGSSTATLTTDGVNGFISENNAASYAERLQQILSNLPSCSAVGAEAQRTLYRNWDQVIDEVEQRYAKAIERKRS